MHWTISFVERLGYLQISVGGKVSLSEIDALNAEIISNPNWHSGMGLLFDSSNVEHRSEESRQMTAVAETVAKVNNEFGKSKIAMFVKTEHQFGLARQYQILSESRSPSQVGVFRDMDAAIDWLVT
jgi:hypothetical protein